MRITRIDLWHVSIPLPDIFWPSWIPGFPQTENRFTLARVTTASGLQGWTAGAALGREREGLGSLLGPYLLGERADDIPSIRQRIREMGYLGMRVGWLEPACWDVVGKARGKPVYELLGGQPGKVRLYASTGEVKQAPERIREVEARLAEGFTAVKLRVHAATLAEDVAQVRDTRRAVGDAVVLGVDANQAWRVAVVADAPCWDLPRARAFCDAAHQAGLAWVEEPLPMDDYDALAALREATEIDVAGGELNNQGLPEFRVMLEKRCYDVYQPDAVFTGGIADTWRIIQRVKEAGARYTPHTWTNGVGFAINLQLHAASPFRQDTLLEYPYNPPGWTPEGRDGILQACWTHDRGTLELPTAPGLGVLVDERRLRRFGHHFFTATRARVAVRTVLDKGIRIARLAGDTRDARLRARHEELESMARAGRDVVIEALSP
ncbi:MAG: mandelate racemase/muconate lactonizing enzyme family protein [Deltaproteobacteria bacterium]|nr:mandelate racemase/muconate lactonizing enzyme family protein [Deltaproteobacteria bacterium]